ncbi:uncharacterized protein LOC106668510 [Cimex lectularius]|uniref:Major facilitator superfamily (MFS) profile domain-containing protein n=1 Tax=Cimex lectularius TaxID=79782 RepID=A0A8I6RWA8_CIMLE|nr:uncharacterized protein LOC106668510 [Cimex lectularius]XP_014252835.1 uncharacterized protein LOC106668510 [Cimex lectularius]XP_024086273.1 uncharacterized protein LOC106668510 [Cimex lectularius]
MFLMESFFTRISEDFRQRELLPLKLLFFVHSSTMYVLYPYLTIHMRELGINIEETAIMAAVTPIVAIVMPPIAGMVADRIGNFKILLSLFSGLGGAASLLLLLVPVGRITISYPNSTVMELDSIQGEIDLRIAQTIPCDRVLNATIPVQMRVEACGLICTRSPEDFIPYDKGPQTVKEENSAILRTRNYTIYIVTPGNGTDSYQYNLGPGDLPLYKARVNNDVRNLKKMFNKGHFSTSVRQLTPTKYFFPASGLYSFDCSVQDKNADCMIKLEKGKESLKILSAESKTFSVKLNNSQRDDKLFSKFWVNEMRPTFGNVSSWTFMELLGSSDNKEVSATVDVPLPNKDNGLDVDAVLHLTKCSRKCLATIPRRSICLNKETVVEYDTKLTFWLYLTIRVFIGMISGTAFAMFEGAVIAILREHKADYGLQRIYATIGGMISSPLSGWLIDTASSDKLYTDFTPAFYLYAAMKIVSALLMMTINLQFKSPATNVLADVLIVLKKVEIVALFITCFILGTAWGYIESFLFWLLQDLGASRSLMGITITVGGIAGLPLLVMSGPIIDKIGHANVLFIGFIFYAIRLLGYSLIYNPWMCLIFEAMESVTSSLAFTAAVTYAAKLSTMTTDSSIQGLLGGLYFGVGKGAGSLIGGYLMEGVGTRPTYQIFSAVTLITGCIYFLFNHFFISHHSDEAKEKRAKEQEAQQEKEPNKDNKNNNTNQKKNGDETVSMSAVSNNLNSNDIRNNIPNKNSNKNVDVENGKINKGFETSEEKINTVLENR